MFLKSICLFSINQSLRFVCVSLRFVHLLRSIYPSLKGSLEYVSEVFKGPSRKMEHGTSREHGRMAYKQKNQSNKKKTYHSSSYSHSSFF